ncbi:MAG: hypothetical protein JJU27_04150 [Gammaproteobacteria bacterium]|nr:hypothetical protein [Gammaproteobacteria bacterium]
MMLLLATGVPLLLALLLLVVPQSGRGVASLAPLAALPLLGAAILGGELRLDSLVLGLHLSVTAQAVPMLLLAGVLWTAAGIAARARFNGTGEGRRYWIFHLLTLCGNAGVFLAQDLAGLYTAYALMTFAAYGLVIHDLTDAALRAGRVYLVMAIAAEVLLLCALLMLGARLGNAPLAEAAATIATHPQANLLLALVFTGFAVKMGTMPLHVWLPLAHPQAPVPASAVLSGVIVKAGLMGWLGLLPPGEGPAAQWSSVVIMLGLISAFAAAALGLTQQRAKSLLAYSTVSQMGLVTLLLGVGLSSPEAWQAMLPVATLFALHHGLAKGALFLAMGVGVAWRGWLMAIAALAIAGLPLSSGAFAKAAAKAFIDNAATEAWAVMLPGLLALSSVLTTLLLLRFLWLAWRPAEPARGSTANAVNAGWLLAVGASVLVVPVWLWLQAPASLAYALQPGQLWSALWPLLLAAVVGAAGFALRARIGLPVLPEGDLVVPAERVLGWLSSHQRPYRSLPQLRGVTLRGLHATLSRRSRHIERRHLDVSIGGMLLMAVALVITWLLVL